jgi:hypothetical protein
MRIIVATTYTGQDKPLHKRQYSERLGSILTRDHVCVRTRGGDSFN